MTSIRAINVLRKCRERWRWKIVIVGLAPGLLALLASGGSSVDFKDLNALQQTLFGTYQQAKPSAQWSELSDSEQVEFAGVTEAMDRWQPDSPSAPHPGAEQLTGISEIHGAIPHAKPEAQFNLEVTWKSGAEGVFKNASGWSPHISVLHPGEHGYQQNSDGDPFLGIVVLFKDGDVTQGQVHIGFWDLWWHYFAGNGNIAENYDDYCSWYRRIDGYLPCPAWDLLGSAHGGPLP